MEQAVKDEDFDFGRERMTLLAGLAQRGGTLMARSPAISSAPMPSAGKESTSVVLFLLRNWRLSLRIAASVVSSTVTSPLRRTADCVSVRKRARVRAEGRLSFRFGVASWTQPLAPLKLMSARGRGPNLGRGGSSYSGTQCTRLRLILILRGFVVSHPHGNITRSRSFDSAPPPSDEDLSLGTPVRSAQDDSGEVGYPTHILQTNSLFS